MPITSQELHHAVLTALPDAEIEIVDLVGDQDHYSLKVTSQAFAGKSRVAQHRLINTALKETLGTQLHALQITTIAK